MALEHDSDSALAKAIRKAGGQSAFAKLFGLRQSTVHSWLARKSDVPPALAIPIEEKLGISRHDLRPDLYPREDTPAQPPAGAPSPPAGGSSSALEGVRA
jgi:DNA-binding transcriptional regulator YdaS (Cro superfamily)